MMWVPANFTHGFLVTSEFAEFLYMTIDYCASEHERCIAWNDAHRAIAWPLDGEPALSAKDRAGAPLRDAETFP
jgi:dTDP-4-dehydrorhamnose 3,5-epimerase